MFGGPFVNLVLAVLLFTVVLVGIGTPTSTTTITEVAACVPAAGATECAAGDPASPGVGGGPAGRATPSPRSTASPLRSGRTSLPLCRRARAPPLRSQWCARARPSKCPSLRRRTRDPTLTAARRPSATWGWCPSQRCRSRARSPGVQLAWDYTGQTLKAIVTLPVQIYHAALATLGIEERSTTSVMGIVGVGRIAGEVASAQVEGYGTLQRIGDMLMLLGGLNLALFAFNMIPLVPLDGGQSRRRSGKASRTAGRDCVACPRPAPWTLRA